MKFIAVYEPNETDYLSNRLCFLENAKDVHIKQSINGDYDMTFKLPKGDKKWGFIEPERKVGYDGEVFRIKTIEGLTVTANTLLQDSSRAHIQYIGDMIARPANEIFANIFEFAKPYVTVLSASELEAIELEPVTDIIDFFELSKQTPIMCLNVLMERLNKYKIHSEIYIDNNKIGIVRSLGTDRGVIVDPMYNANDITATRSSFGLVTKLYPYGRDDLHIGSVNGGKQYILSENYEKFGEFCAFSNFDEIKDPAELLEAAKYQISPNNTDRIDVPRYSVTFKFIDLKANEKIKLGDTVTVNDRVNGIKSKQRVTSVDIYPFEPNRSTFSVGKTGVTIQEAFTGSFSASQYLDRQKNRSQEFKTSAIEFMDKNENVTVENDKGEVQKIGKYKTGAMFVSPDGEYAVAIIDGKVKVGERPPKNEEANYPDGWKWTGVFGQGRVTVNEVFTGVLYTNLCTVMSQNGKLEIKDNLITMYDGNSTLRFKSGYDGKRYVFELFNAEGDKTLYMDDSGNLTLTGVFRTREEGEARTVIDGNGIQSYNENGQKHGLWSNADGRFSDFATYYNDSEIFKIYNAIDYVSLYACKNSFLTANSKGARFTNGADGSFATADGKTITVSGGIITGVE